MEKQEKIKKYCDEKRELTFTKNAILQSKRFADKRDILSVILKEHKLYTIAEIQKLLQEVAKKQMK
ncbi:hypothetical protein AAK894_13105 [Lachnospiraceae bacterium 46-61]